MAYPDSIEAIFAKFAEKFCATMATVVQRQLEAMKQTRPILHTEQHIDNQLKDHPISDRKVLISGYTEEDDCLCVVTNTPWSTYDDTEDHNDVLLSLEEEESSTAHDQGVQSTEGSHKKKSVTKNVQQLFDKMTEPNLDTNEEFFGEELPRVVNRRIPEYHSQQKSSILALENSTTDIGELINVSQAHKNAEDANYNYKRECSHALANEYIAAIRPEPPDADETQRDMPLSKSKTSKDELEHSYGEVPNRKVEAQVFDEISQRTLCCNNLFYGNNEGAVVTLSQYKLHMPISVAENKSLIDGQRQWWKFKPKHMDKGQLYKKDICYEILGLSTIHRAAVVHSNNNTKVDDMSVEASYNIFNFMSMTQFHFEDKVNFEGHGIDTCHVFVKREMGIGAANHVSSGDTALLLCKTVWAIQKRKFGRSYLQFTGITPAPGNKLSAELIQTLMKMAPTAEEELKLRLYSRDVSQIGLAKQFLKAMFDIPFSFKCLESLLFMCFLQKGVSSTEKLEKCHPIRGLQVVSNLSNELENAEDDIVWLLEEEKRIISMRWFLFFCEVVSIGASPTTNGTRGAGLVFLMVLSKFEVVITIIFEHENMIGEGCNSQVYRDYLVECREITMKIWKQYKDMFEKFVLGIETIIALQSGNIISMFGFCLEDTNILWVYDFLPEGSFEDNLHGNKVFGWSVRYKVVSSMLSFKLFMITGFEMCSLYWYFLACYHSNFLFMIQNGRTKFVDIIRTDTFYHLEDKVFANDTTESQLIRKKNQMGILSNPNGHGKEGEPFVHTGSMHQSRFLLMKFLYWDPGIDEILQLDGMKTQFWRKGDELFVAVRELLLFMKFSSQSLSYQSLEVEIACLNYVQEMELFSVIAHSLMESPACHQGRPEFFSIWSRYLILIESIFEYLPLLKLYIVLGTGKFFEILGSLLDMWEKWVELFMIKETIKMHVLGMGHSNACNFFYMLLDAIQSICESYDCKVDVCSAMGDGRAMGCLMGKHVTTSYSESIMAWGRELAQYLETDCQQERIAEVGAFGGNIGEGKTTISINKNHNLFGMLGLVEIFQSLAFKGKENRNQMKECNVLPTLIKAAVIHYKMLHSLTAAIHYKMVDMNGNLVQSSSIIRKEVLFAGLLHTIIRLLNFCYLTKSLSEWYAEEHNQHTRLRYLDFYPP